VDDAQLSLAIGKKGQNVRLAAKLLGWKVDIKSEEEKRQEVESAMAALVTPSEPISALIAHGLSEELAAKLAEAGISAIENLGGMTPEQLQEIPGIDPEMVENIRESVTSYYSQFEEQIPQPEELPEAEAMEPESGAEDLAPAIEEASVLAEDVSPAEESDTIKDSGAVSHDESENSGSVNE